MRKFLAVFMVMTLILLPNVSYARASEQPTNYLEDFFSKHGNHYTSKDFVNNLIDHGLDASISVTYSDRKTEISPQEFVSSKKTEYGTFSYGDSRLVHIDLGTYFVNVTNTNFMDISTLMNTVALILGGPTSKIMGLAGFILDIVQSLPEGVNSKLTIANHYTDYFDLYEVYTPDGWYPFVHTSKRGTDVDAIYQQAGEETESQFYGTKVHGNFVEIHFSEHWGFDGANLAWAEQRYRSGQNCIYFDWWGPRHIHVRNDFLPPDIRDY